ncbi:type III PLP-dependent enzyme domain-containing protein [Rhodococcus opacus]|uniref:diaminopimelate decarboxylase n=1 Tax=Rhodococcus opacus TaxID=37919 RepID=UPI0022357629|nr:diaminopimelate decarboxylase [Rhodococcus opacus]UZG55251.1 diaminopimelate decarboxylase [Rhodococcus opacus]
MALRDFLPSFHEVTHPRMDPLVWPLSLHHDINGRLVMSGVPLCDVADEYATPVCVIDESDLRGPPNVHRNSGADAENADPGRHFLVNSADGCVRTEGRWIDASARGDPTTALATGVDPSRIIVRAEAIPEAELRAALSVRIGHVVLGSLGEITRLAALLERPQRVVLGISPDIDTLGRPIASDEGTAQGLSVKTGAADTAISLVLHQRLLDLVGLQCSVGSAAGNLARDRAAVNCIVGLMNQVQTEHGVVLTELDLAEGRTPPPNANPDRLDLRELAEAIDDAVEESCAEFRFPRPRIVLEPSPVADFRSAVVLFRVAAVERTPGGSFIRVESGADANLRGLLRNSHRTVVLANRHSHGLMDEVTVTAVRHDQGVGGAAYGVQLPSDVRAGDLLAVACTTGYAATGYPRVVAVHDGLSRPLGRHELGEDHDPTHARSPADEAGGAGRRDHLLHGEYLRGSSMGRR